MRFSLCRIVGVVACMVLLSFSHLLQAQELVRNPAFEEGGSPIPQGWFRDLKQTGKEGDVSIDTSRVHSGQASLKITANERNGTSHPLAVAQVIPASAYRGQKLKISGYMIAEGGVSAAVGVLSLVGKKLSNLVIISQSPGSKDWTRQEGAYKVPDAGNVQLIVTCFVNGKGGTGWFDDISLAPEGAALSAPPPRGPAAPTESASPRGTKSGHSVSARIDVDASRVLRDIPNTLYGANVEWIWNGNFMWDEDTRRINPELLQLTKDLGVAVLRYPGGHYSDYYHWKDGVGDFSRRSVAAHEPGKGDKSRINLGTDEMLHFAEDINGELLITVNAGSGTAQEAANWVRYVNAKSTRARYWEIGNELYINDGSPMSKATTLNPSAYARRFLDFAKAMKEADPHILVGAIGGVNQAQYQFVNYPDWNRTVLEHAGDQIDFFCVHNAYAPGLFHGEPGDVSTVYKGMFGAVPQIAANLDKVAQDIAEYAPSRSGKIKIAVTEWGPLFQYDPNSHYVEHTKTLGSALFVASLMKAFIENPQTEIANFFLLNDVTVMGWIGSRSSQFPPQPQWTPTARYFAFQMYTHHFGRRLIRSSTQGPTFNGDAIGLWDSSSDVPYLDSIASLSEDGRTLYIVAVNKSEDAALQTDIGVHGFRPASKASTWTLTGSSLDANTGTVPIKLPGLRWASQSETHSHGMSRPSPDDVKVSPGSIADAGENFTYVFPPLSVTALELRR